MLLGTVCVFRVFILSRTLEWVSLVAHLFKKKKKEKEIRLQRRRPRFNPWIGKIPWRRKWQPTPVFLLGESHGQRSLAGCRVGHDYTTTTTEHSNALVPERPWWKVGLCCRAVPPSLGLTLWSGGAHRRLELWHHHNGNWLGLGPCPGYTTYNL